MNQRKTMKLWQMIVLLILPVVLLATMFLPAYHINGKAAKKICDKMSSSEEIPELAKAIIGSIDTDKVQEDTNEKIAELEEENDIQLSYIAPARIMTHDFQSFFGELGEKDAFSDMESIYTKQRIMLWVVYVLAATVILILVLGYCLKWVKYIPLGISAGYGMVSAVIFGIFQFAAPRFVADNVNLKDVLGLGVLVTNLLEYVLDQFLDSSIAKIIACFWGVSFLTAFIIAILLAIISVIFVFIGNAKDYASEQTGQAGGLWENRPDKKTAWMSMPGGSVKNAWVNEPDGQVGVVYGHDVSGNSVEIFIDNKAASGQVSEPKSGVKPKTSAKASIQSAGSAASPMGRVMCTKGVAVGQGFSLPEDRKVVVGKNSRHANLVVGYPHISNIHCSICYKAAANSYIVKDHSTNGTFVNGVRLQRDTAIELPAGTVLQLADGRNEITLG